MESISLYDETNIQSCPWPKTPQGVDAKEFLEPLITKGINHFVDNIHVKMAVLIVNDQAIPITVNDREENSFVCSPYSHYVSYALVLDKKINGRFLSGCYRSFLSLYGRIMRYGQIYKVINVNSWLFTTSPYIKLDSETVQRITSFLKCRFPDYAILYPSIIQKMSAKSYESLVANRYKLIPSKCVYITDGGDKKILKARILKSDLKFLKESSLQVMDSGDISPVDIDAFQKLYHALYIQKYSSLNPAYNANFFELLIKSKALTIVAVKDSEVVQGVTGYLARDGWMISPLFGYDPLQSENKGIYRYLSASLIQEAFKNQEVFNQSSGGSFFKKIRHGKPHLEYMAVDVSHLPFSRKIAWGVLSTVMKTVGRRIMEKY
jgi:hypothetical protein